MNYLAHAFLAGPAAADRVGGIAGDFVKGLLPGTLPPDLAAGVALHRAIDVWAEQHPAFRASRARVSAGRRRYAGILVDLFYDHFLARHWPRFHPQPLTRFTAEVYAAASARAHELPVRFAAVLPHMCDHDWLAAYRERAHVAAALDGMSRRRARQPNPLAGAIEELDACPAGFEADCLDFLPDALAFVAARRAGA
ncbi:ACP phosphodiesterase [Niveibacterium umoris]|uniref:Acyl carrier protein phosphodiesterase n=1 Tax=Niveibacterium umoris TaxID=1193620 RepID=A0A840BT22_9RHOO|nr:acyl carrier protein phosphodiesterase [Niveibacterium umoris]